MRTMLGDFGESVRIENHTYRTKAAAENFLDARGDVVSLAELVDEPPSFGVNEDGAAAAKCLCRQNCVQVQFLRSVYFAPHMNQPELTLRSRMDVGWI